MTRRAKLLFLGMLFLIPALMGTYKYPDVLWDGLTTQILVGGGAGFDPVWTAATGTLAPVRADSPTFTTKITTPTIDNSEGNITNVGNIALDSISSDSGTSINVDLGSDAGDDFTVDTSKLVVEGDTGNVGIGTGTPAYLLTLSSSVVQGTKIGLYNTASHANNRNWAINTNITDYGDLHFIVGASEGAAPTLSKIVINKGGNFGIGDTSPDFNLEVAGSIGLQEMAAAIADEAGTGQIWVANSTPNELWFTDDAGTDTQVSSHPLDAPPALYNYGPGIDYIGKRVQHYLGVIFWQTIDGIVTEETFDAYNIRRKDVDGHKDLVKRDWNAAQLAVLKAEKKKEGKVVPELQAFEVVEAKDAFDAVEIMGDVQVSTKTEYKYEVDSDGKVNVASVIKPVTEKQGTGKFEKKLKSGISFNSETGQFIRMAEGVSKKENGTYWRELTDAEVDALEYAVPKMPPWMEAYKAAKLEPK